MAKKADQCTRQMLGYSALCALQPKSKISQCLKEASQFHEICTKTSGVSAGDAHHQQPAGDRPYKKSDGRVYIRQGAEIPYNGKVWNGYCYAIYRNGELVHWEDRVGNWCDNQGVLNGHDN